LHIKVHAIDLDLVRRIILEQVEEVDGIGIIGAVVGCPDNAWPGVVGIDLPELGCIDYDSTRDG